MSAVSFDRSRRLDLKCRIRRPTIISTKSAEVDFGGDQRAGHAAITQDGRAVGNFQDFVHIVRDEKHAGALAGDLTHETEQPVDPSAGKKWRRFIQNQNTSAAVFFLAFANILERSDNRHQGALDLRQICDPLIRIDGEPEARKYLLCAPSFARPGQVPTISRCQIADAEIFEHAQRGHQAKILMDEGEP